MNANSPEHDVETWYRRWIRRDAPVLQSAVLASADTAGHTDELSLKDRLMLKSGSVEERLEALVLELLQLGSEDFETAGAMEESFSNLGADSMQAMQFMSRLQVSVESQISST